MLSVDGAKGTGWALWDVSSSHARADLRPPLHVGNIVPVKGMPWEQAIDWTCMQIDEVFNRFNDSRKEAFIDEVVCEYPQYMPSFKGQTSAASGDLVKLCIMYGRINQIAVYHSATFKGVEVSKWKGQLSKEAVIHHVRKRLGDAVCARYSNHVWDAVGLGLNEKGLWIEG
jgi:hypothetical protein